MAMSAWVFFAHNAPLNGPLIFSLGFFVWAIYLFDHAFDAERLPSLGFRRKTHFKNRKGFWGLGAFALLCSAGLYIPFMPLLSRTSGLFLAITLFLILCYFGIGLLPPLKRLQGYKEFFLPPGYTFGVALPFVWSQNQPLPDALFLFGISLLVLQSILLLAKLDAQEDDLRKQQHLPSKTAYNAIFHCFWCLLCPVAGNRCAGSKDRSQGVLGGLGTLDPSRLVLFETPYIHRLENPFCH